MSGRERSGGEQKPGTARKPARSLKSERISSLSSHDLQPLLTSQQSHDAASRTLSCTYPKLLRPPPGPFHRVRAVAPLKLRVNDYKKGRVEAFHRVRAVAPLKLERHIEKHGAQDPSTAFARWLR